MFDDEIPDEQIPELLNSLRETEENVDRFMKTSYVEICFLGTSPKNIGGELLEAVSLNIRICIEYYIQNEDYIKVAKLKTLYRELTKPSKVKIDLDILQNISVSHN
jgi:hypothetical protein